MTSLSRRISIATVAVTAVSVGVAAVGVWIAARWQLIESVDDLLAPHLSRITRQVQTGWVHTPVRIFPADARTNILFWDIADAKTCTEILHSTSLDGSGISFADAARHAPGVPYWITLPDGRRLRAESAVVSRAKSRDDALNDIVPPLPLSDHSTITLPASCLVVMAIDGSAIDRELFHFAVELAFLWSLACSLAVLASMWLRRAILQPVLELARAIRSIDIEKIPRRIAVDVPIEMEVVRSRLDELFVRLHQVLEREKGTIANIAHELRTPIAGLRTTLEFSALGTEESGSSIATRCLPTVLAMQGMIANLLTLARIEAGQEKVHLQEVALDALVRDCWRSLQPMATNHSTRLQEITRNGSCLVRTCPDKARMVVANLLDNAVSHSPLGAVIAVNLSHTDGSVRLAIENPISGPDPDPQGLFQAFWRNDRARAGSGLHCGLGLALCRRLMPLLGGSINADTSSPGIFRIEVLLPAPGRDPSQAAHH